MSTNSISVALAILCLSALCQAAPPESDRPDKGETKRSDGGSSAANEVVKPDAKAVGEPKLHNIQLFPELKALQDELEKIQLPEPISKKLGEVLPRTQTHDPVDLSRATAAAIVLGITLEWPKIEQKLSDMSQSYDIGVQSVGVVDLEWTDGTFEVNVQVDFGTIRDLDFSTIGPIDIVGAEMNLKMTFP